MWCFRLEGNRAAPENDDATLKALTLRLCTNTEDGERASITNTSATSK